MRWRAAMVASAILFHGVHTSAFAGQPAETARPAPDAAVAVAIGLAWADRADEPFEWIRVCGPNGCRLMPRLSPPGGAQASPGEDPDAAAAPSAAGDDGSEGDSYGCGLSARRRLFGRRR